MSKIEEVSPTDYQDYRAARKLSRPSHKIGDTAVMGWREKLDLPYWIHKAMCRGGYKNEWSWVFESDPIHGPNANTSKFGKMFPEFLVLNGPENAVKERHRIKTKDADPIMQRLRTATEDNYALAVFYLNNRRKNIKDGVAI